jgi:hypothetical protein
MHRDLMMSLIGCRGFLENLAFEKFDIFFRVLLKIVCVGIASNYVIRLSKRILFDPFFLRFPILFHDK